MSRRPADLKGVREQGWEVGTGRRKSRIAGFCVIFVSIYGIAVQVLLEAQEVMEKGTCSAPSGTCSINNFLKTIL